MATSKERRARVACELDAANVVAARATANLLDVSVIRALPPGAVIPSLTGANIPGREAVKTTVQEALAAVAGRARDIITVLPDAACRLTLLDLDALPAKRDDADAVVRFRLKKSLPFDVDRARVSWQAQRAGGKLTVLAAVTLTTVLEEYESVVREAGYSPGVVLPSMLAALGQVDASLPTLVIKIDATTTSVAVVANGVVLLVRTLDHASGRQPGGAQLAEDVYPSLVFFQDTYGAKVENILVSGLAEFEELNAALADIAGVRAQELVKITRLGVAGAPQRAALGAVAGALA
jgi:type IV pilus assembly protein PilM